MSDFDSDVFPRRTQSTLPAFDALNISALPVDEVDEVIDGVTVDEHAAIEPRYSRRHWLALSLAACGAGLTLAARPAHAIVHPDAQALRFLDTRCGFCGRAGHGRP